MHQAAHPKRVGDRPATSQSRRRPRCFRRHRRVEALEKILEQAKRGEVIGIAYAVMYKKRYCAVDTTGQANRSPSSREVAALDDYIRDQSNMLT